MFRRVIKIRVAGPSGETLSYKSGSLAVLLIEEPPLNLLTVVVTVHCSIDPCAYDIEHGL